MYQKHGIEGFYKKYGKEYHNPHEPQINKVVKHIVNSLPLDLSKILDLACGSGEVTVALMEEGYNNIEGIDPYTKELYEERTKKNCKSLTFEDIAKKGLKEDYSTIFCSFALHLLDESYLDTLIYQLSLSCKDFIVLSPHKRPIIKETEFITLKDSFKIDDVLVRWYKLGY